MEVVARKKQLIKLLMEEVQEQSDNSCLTKTSDIKGKIYSAALDAVDDMNDIEELEDRLSRVISLYTGLMALQAVSEKISEIVEGREDDDTNELFDIFKDVSEDIKSIQSDVQIDGEQDERKADTDGEAEPGKV